MICLITPRVTSTRAILFPYRRDLSNPSENKDFAFIKIIARITLQLVRKFWHVSSAGFLAFFLLYWLFGGILAFLVVIFGITGE